jgi:hypothetical protein
MRRAGMSQSDTPIFADFFQGAKVDRYCTVPNRKVFRLTPEIVKVSSRSCSRLAPMSERLRTLYSRILIGVAL